MPLPPALLARLQKRGIINESNEESKEKVEECEEVIAEDYDEPNSKSLAFTNKKLKAPVTGCPNKYNIYHECSDFCQKRWGLGKENASPTLKRKYQKLIKKYPLPDEWQQIWDPGVACYYFWNTDTDEVSWLPPSHPKAIVSMSASKLRAMIKEDENMSDDSENEKSSEDGIDSDSSLSSASDSESEVDSDEHNTANKKQKVSPSKRNDYYKYKDKHGRERVKRNDLDPMDPAAYSESCPRGKWSDGLEQKGDAKTGADPTASGPLYQVRPYPNPGSVLRMNKKQRLCDED
ncbi:polyglutamine-binding protein 1-like protein [Dinothrombium tinctorium]|uniref:Polyglutamine-binding protein 1 n=1 Tax=Dinothrombium tinctorium TaxID=1965070 RepID=A0A3S3P4V3_9ACAR|nr:polyglutamine-binding protein 1-like protein [Dinothrombium tinctorium]